MPSGQDMDQDYAAAYTRPDDGKQSIKSLPKEI